MASGRQRVALFIDWDWPCSILDAPERCLRRGDEWAFGPEEPYEQIGDVGNVVFPCGYTIAPDGDTTHLYYGAADTSIALATGSIRAMLDWLEQRGIGPES